MPSGSRAPGPTLHLEFELRSSLVSRASNRANPLAIASDAYFRPRHTQRQNGISNILQLT